MTLLEYIAELEAGLEEVLQDPKFNNYENQLSARKISAAFNATYDENYLWNRALFLSTNGCQVLLNGDNERLAFRSLRESAQIYENLYHTSERFDREFSLILSSLCYDLAGYQANAVCLVKKTPVYELTSVDDQVDVISDNYILKHLRQILLKNIPLANNILDRQLDIDPGILLFNNAVFNWYQQILSLNENDLLRPFELVYRYYLNTFNIPISHLIFLLKTRITLFHGRAIWHNLSEIEQIHQNDQWKKYIRLLANDIYDGRRVKPLEHRLSKFEFWTSQLRAIQKGLLSTNESFVVQMPTSAGKTFIAELSILNALITFPGYKCLYVSPFRALTNEKENELADNLSKLGYSVSALSGNYEIDEFQEIVLSDTDVLIATPEKIDLLLRINPDYFQHIALAVVDEGHILGDISSRSSLLEFLMIRLRITNSELKILFISAVMPPENANEYALWLSQSANNVIRSSLHPDSPANEEWEPTRKLIGRFTWEGNNGRISYKDMQTEDEETRIATPSYVPAIIRKRQYGGTYPNGTTKAQTSAALAYRLSEDGNTLVFCAQVRETDRVGTALLNLLTRLQETNAEIHPWFQLNTDRESYFFARKWFGVDSYITRCLSYGIGIHFGDLPEAVRRSVEEDFVRGNLRVLISTNTIGQGLNFPIKNLIIHSTIITVSDGQPETIRVRDFWNIIGRAGRAGMETEGQIIFNVNSWFDGQEFNKYTNKANIDPAYSLFFNVLNALVENRISQSTFENNIRILAEPYILNLIAEETTGTDDETVINTILQNSLFRVQCEQNQIEVEPIRSSFRSIFATIKEENTVQQIRVYGETGLCVRSNREIETFIDEHFELVTAIIEEDSYRTLIELIYELFDNANIEELESEKIDRIDADYEDFLPVTLLWMEGAEIDIMQTAWQNVSTNNSHLNILIAEGFYYRFPWIMNAFITISLFKLGLERDSLGEDISNVISYMKYGINNQQACLLRSIGIKNRDVALLLAGMANGLTGRELIRWIANLAPEDLSTLSLARFDESNILNIGLKLTPNKFDGAPDVLEFFVKGISFDNERKAISGRIEVDDSLTYRREPNNIFDPFAIELYFNNGKLGYVPREFAKLLSVEIDINSADYELVVIEIQVNGDYDDIKVRMSRL